MKQYILKLKTTSTTNYALYDGTTALTDAQLTTLFTTAGSAYFTFDLDSLTPSATNAITIVDSSDTAVVTNTNLTDTIVETKDFKGTWSASATAFDTFVALSGVAMDEAQLSFLMGKIKSAIAGGIRELTTADYNYPTTGTKTSIAWWKLDSGIYRFASSMALKKQSSDAGAMAVRKNDTMIVIHGTSAGMILVSTDKSVAGYYVLSLSTENLTFRMLFNLQDNLISTSTESPLSAAQGKVLKDLIDSLIITNVGAPTTSTVGTVGQLLADTTNGKLYICTDATNPYVWEEIGAGGGGIQNALIIREWS